MKRRMPSSVSGDSVMCRQRCASGSCQALASIDNARHDIPQAAYQIFFNQRHMLGAPRDQLDAMNRAISKGHSRTILALMQENGKVVGKDVADFGKVFEAIIAGAHVPAVLVTPIEIEDSKKAVDADDA